MGVWGDLPWDNDYALDFAAEALGSMVQRVRERLAAPRRETDAADLCAAVACCDLFVRLAPYWDPDSFEEDFTLAEQVLRGALEEKKRGGERYSYEQRLLACLETYRTTDPLLLGGVPPALGVTAP